MVATNIQAQEPELKEFLKKQDIRDDAKGY
jgi:hypothetical protein